MSVTDTVVVAAAADDDDEHVVCRSIIDRLEILISSLTVRRTVSD